jgi:Ca2+-binding EF-hand superfamily protein
MTRSTRLLLTTGLIGLGAAAFAGVSLAGGDWGRHHGPGGRGAQLFESFDVDGDGRITQVEIDEVRQGRLAEFDADGDGSLSLEEYQALWVEAMREHMVDRFQAHDDDGDGLVTAEEFGARFEGMISRLDDDSDGAVTRDELRHRHRDRDHDGDRDGDQD